LRRNSPRTSEKEGEEKDPEDLGEGVRSSGCEAMAA